MTQITDQIASELAVRPEQVQAVIDLLGEGATVPFIARYRKHLHGDLDDQQIRVIEERRVYLAEMNERRETILGTISEQGKLTDELKASILRATTKAELEDLYLPYRPKRRTKAQIALEAGLGPLADALLAHPERDPNAQAGGFLKPDAAIDTPQAALEGAKARFRPILMTSFAFIAGLIPLVFATGPGRLGNRTIGTAAAGGMLLGTIFGVIIVPGLYYVFGSIASKHKLIKNEDENPLTEEI